MSVSIMSVDIYKYQFVCYKCRLLFVNDHCIYLLCGVNLVQI